MAFNTSTGLKLPDLPPVPEIEAPQGADPSQVQVEDLRPIQQVAAPTLGALGPAAANPQQEVLGTEIQKLLGGGLDRSGLVQEQLDLIRPQLDERFQNQLTAAGRQAAALGRGGLGETETRSLEIARKASEDERRITGNLVLQAKQAEFADRFQTLGLSSQLAQQLAQQAISREQLQSGRDVSGAQFGLQAGLANQQTGLQAGLQGQQLGLQAALSRAGFDESQADRIMQGLLQGQQLGVQQTLGGLQSATSIQQSQISAAAQQAAAQAAARAQVQAAQIGADAATTRQMMQQAFDGEQLRFENMFRQQQFGEGQRQFDVGTMFQNQQFQNQQQQQTMNDLFRWLGLSSDVGYAGQPDLGQANTLLQNALGQGATNYGADAAAAGQQAGAGIGSVTSLLDNLLNSGGGAIGPIDLNFPSSYFG